MERFDYPVRLSPSVSGGITATCRDFPMMLIEACNAREAIADTVIALEGVMGEYMGKGLPLPTPSQARSDELYVAPPAEVSAKLALYVAMADAGISKVQLAKQLGVDEKEVRRLLDPSYRSKLPRLAKAVEVLGHRLVIGLELMQQP